jgi:hypothetical protein
LKKEQKKPLSGVPIFGLNLLIKVLHLKFTVPSEVLSVPHAPNKLTGTSSGLRKVNPSSKID